jgi:hypothetical protein
LEQDSGRREKSPEPSQGQDVEKSETETPRRPPNGDDEKAVWRASGKRSEFSLSGLAHGRVCKIKRRYSANVN